MEVKQEKSNLARYCVTFSASDFPNFIFFGLHLLHLVFMLPTFFHLFHLFVGLLGNPTSLMTQSYLSFTFVQASFTVRLFQMYAFQSLCSITFLPPFSGTLYSPFCWCVSFVYTFSSYLGFTFLLPFHSRMTYGKRYQY